MTKDEALKMALRALELWHNAGEVPSWYGRQDRIDTMNAIRQALDQSPDTTKMSDNLTKAKQYLTQGALVPVDIETTTLLLDALRQALAEPDNHIAELRTRLNQMRDFQEWGGVGFATGERIAGYNAAVDEVLEHLRDMGPDTGTDRGAWADVPDATKREWVGLTDEELNDLARWADEHGGAFHVAYGKAIEAKLKEKNT